MERRLVAILAADVVGYSRLMGGDEEATLATLNAYREVIDRLVADHHGRVFGSAGDSVIAEFASPVEAVRCAIKIQQELESRNAGLAGGGRTTSDGLRRNDLQKNRRVGVTVWVPLARRHGIKLVFVSGVTTRIGADFDSILVAYQYRWGAGL